MAKYTYGVQQGNDTIYYADLEARKKLKNLNHASNTSRLLKKLLDSSETLSTLLGFSDFEIIDDYLFWMAEHTGLIMNLSHIESPWYLPNIEDMQPIGYLPYESEDNSYVQVECVKINYEYILLVVPVNPDTQGIEDYSDYGTLFYLLNYSAKINSINILENYKFAHEESQYHPSITLKTNDVSEFQASYSSGDLIVSSKETMSVLRSSGKYEGRWHLFKDDSLPGVIKTYIELPIDASDNNEVIIIKAYDENNQLLPIENLLVANNESILNGHTAINALIIPEIDDEPIEGSSNAISSDGVFMALANKIHIYSAGSLGSDLSSSIGGDNLPINCLVVITDIDPNETYEYYDGNTTRHFKGNGNFDVMFRHVRYGEIKPIMFSPIQFVEE